jgi:hypothetical protein
MEGPDASLDSGEMDVASPVPEAAAEASVADATPEAAPPAVDAAPEASPEDAAADTLGEAGTTVTVRVVGALGYEQGITIVWGDSTGAVRGTSTTNAQGIAAYAAAAGDMVTALLGSPSAASLTTIMGIQPGDALVFADRTTLPSPQFVQINAFPPSPPTGTVEYYVWNPGNYYTAPITFPLTFGVTPALGLSGSTVGESFAERVSADTDINLELGFVFAKNLGASNVDGGPASVALSGPWSTSFTTQQFVVQSPDGSTPQGTDYAEIASGVAFYPSTEQESDGSSPPVGTQLYMTHPGFADYVQGWAFTQTPVTGGGGGALEIAVSEPAPSGDGSLTIDWGDIDAMPTLTSIAVDSTNPAQPALSVTTSSGSLATTTAVIALATWSGSTDGGPDDAEGSWLVVSPGTAGPIQIPQLPGGSAWSLASLANVSLGDASVYAVQGSALPGYAQVRAAAGIFTLKTNCLEYTGPLLPPLLTSGMLMVSAITTGGCG